MQRSGRTVRVVAVALCGLALAAGRTAADDKPAKEAAKPDAKQLNAIGKKLLEGLKATPGCLGVETAATQSGKRVVFAFFENKKAAEKWYYSPVHQALMDMVAPDRNKKHKPMAGVPDDVPVMALASISFGGKPAYEKSKLPFSQIAIELYTPLSGGLNIGGGFAPEKFLELKRATPAPRPEK
jgi:hypothetical protein